jgi:hypothetical protein
MKTTLLIRIVCGIVGAAWLALPGLASAQARVGLATVNGQTTVNWRGEEVFSGRTEGPVRSLAASVGRDEFAAVLERDTVLWENVPGAAQKAKSALTASAGVEKKSGDRSKVALRRLKPPASTGLCVTTADGLTTVTWEGRQVYVGPTKGHVTAKVKTIVGAAYAAVFEDGKVVWQNEKGAAEKVK